MTDDRSQPHPPIVGVGAALGDSRELYKRQRAALVKAEDAALGGHSHGIITLRTTEVAVAAYLQHMRETEET